MRKSETLQQPLGLRPPVQEDLVMSWNWSPFMIPLGAFVVAIVAIVAGIMSDAHKQRLRAEQRMSMVARGMSVEDIDKLMGGVGEDAKPSLKDPLRSLGYARRTAIVLVSVGLGIAVFGLILT